jgi:hypothetical protein
MFRCFYTTSHRTTWVVLALTCLNAFAPQAQAARKSNAPPVISGTPPTVTTVDTAYGFRPQAADPDGDRISFRISGKPSWATFNSSTGQLSGTPTTIGTYGGISIRVTDGRTAVALPTFSISVKANIAVAVNTPPMISGMAPPSVVAGSSYFFQPTGYDADGDSLAYSVVNKPIWAQFDGSTGALSGTPTTANVGTYSNITINVSDGVATSSAGPFSVTVTDPITNQAPTIAGTPVTAAQVDRPYAFGPTTADADGDALTFTIQGKPSWATFETSTGTLYGTPGATSVGTYSNIVISATDGQAIVALAPFAITVSPAPTKNVTLKWTPPTTYTDGSPLTDLAGFTVFYGTSSRQYSASIKLPGATTTSVVLEGFEQGTWYFSVKALNAAGVESDFATEAVAVL